MKVLIISSEIWNDSTNGGNVLSNIFANTEFEFAQIYCHPGVPQNSLCRRYYQMTDSMAIKCFFNQKPIGREFELMLDNNKKNNTLNNVENTKGGFYSFFHKYRLNIFYIAKDIVWNVSNWKNDKLKSFVLDFNPDIIFAPSYGEIFMQRLTRYVADISGKKVISYISDDSYTLNQFSLSPFYWIRRFAVRHQIRITFPYYSIVYTMTEVQKKQCENDFRANMKLLLKPIPFGNIPSKKTVGHPIKIVYAGSLFLNRWKTLTYLADTIREINKDEIKIILNIYTNNEITKKINKKLNDGSNCLINKCVSQEKLKEIYHNSDIALHVESFDLKNKLAVRMSFSTKIVDCLASGCAVMAICDEKQGGYKYLKENDIAICISNKNYIEKTLIDIINNYEIIIKYEEKAKKHVLDNLSKERISKMIVNDFNSVLVGMEQ